MNATLPDAEQHATKDDLAPAIEYINAATVATHATTARLEKLLESLETSVPAARTA